MPEEVLKTTNKTNKKQESKKSSSSPNNHASKKQSRKGENPVRLSPASEQSPDFGYPNSGICKNSACRAVLSIENTSCKRCSCCICHSFDDNKDPSLWLVCTSESGESETDSCGLSCHIECAIRREKVGVVGLGQLMQLDGSYCCASCGKVSGILGIWKKQLLVAKDARRVDVLWDRICLSYKLLDGTSRYKELHDIVKEAKTKLEKELGPINGESGTMVRGIVSRLSIAGDVLKLCSLAIEKTDEWLASVASAGPTREGSLPAACKFLFEEITPSSVVIILIELSNADNIKGYKLWYQKSRKETHTKEPTCTFSRSQRRILICNLQPCTEYTFRIISFTETGDLGHSEAKCFTKSVEIIPKNLDSPVCRTHKKETSIGEASSSVIKESETSTAVVPSSEFKVRDLGKILRLAQTQQKSSLEGFCSANIEKCCGPSNPIKTESLQEDLPSVSRGLDLNVLSMPDLNEELAPPFESSRDEDNECTLQQTLEAVDDAASHDVVVKNGLARFHGSGDSQTWNHVITGDVPAVDSRAQLGRKRKGNTNEETQDCDSTLINGPPLQNGSCCLDKNFEYCVKIIRWLECEGHLKEEFRLKLLTWFSLRSTEQERRVVNTFIQTMIDDPSSLAGQLVDSFSDIVSLKRQRNGSCSIFS